MKQVAEPIPEGVDVAFHRPEAAGVWSDSFEGLRHGSLGLDGLAAVKSAWTKENIQSEFRVLLHALQQVLQETLADLSPTEGACSVRPLVPCSYPANRFTTTHRNDDRGGATQPTCNSDSEGYEGGPGFEPSQWRLERPVEEP